ncbi:hypothetical protein [Serratia fonticola]|uniref:hypothetical protein n=1 Tax=Serratia fonticola TaxID=47917 RepID=UPI0016447068|nr:hypothetical protein [Serratia fonticola]MBC3217253.1 hypothetical protein [Serratia fonticola]
MNRLPQPIYDDSLALENLANNPRVRSYPNLQTTVAAIQEGYTQYEAVRGNAFNVTNVPITDAEGSYLKAHYQDPPSDLEHIKTLRKNSEHHLCPMCGSFHCGTLDHLLPKKGYEAFAVFSLNLVPACKCNSIRKETLKGSQPGERILHPYFDDCLTERLLAAQFEDLGPVPRVKLRLCIDNTHPEHAAIAYHVRSIVERTAITNYLRDRWIVLCRKPSLVVRSLRHNPPTSAALRELLIEELEQLDDLHRGKNNWDSIFIVGLLDQDVLEWVFQHISIPGRVENSPLI